MRPVKNKWARKKTTFQTTCLPFFNPLPYLCRNKTTSKDHPIFEQVICDRCMVYFCLIIRFLQGCSSPFLKHQAEE
jgi:hypothetical protein